MSNHLALRSGNPALQSSTFKKQFSIASEGSMTLSGTVNKTGISLFLVLMSASYSWVTPAMHPLAFPAAILGFILALVNIYKPQQGHIFVPAYAIVQGVFLGTISMVFNKMYPGIVVQAIFLTFGTLGALLLAYKSGLIRATENFKLGVFAATGGIAFLYLINFVMGFFSAFVVVIAALNLVLDFDFIEEGVEKGAPKYMEWFGAFGLLVTLIWLYIEILRLLAKLNSRR